MNTNILRRVNSLLYELKESTPLERSNLYSNITIGRSDMSYLQDNLTR